MTIAQLLIPALCSAGAVFLAGQVIQWRQRRAERDAAAGRAVTVAGSIRPAAGPRLGRLWRYGTVTVRGDQIMWRPRTPWGRSLVLGGVGFASRRPVDGPMSWQLPPAAVVVPCSHAARDLELAVLPASVKYLFWAQTARPAGGTTAPGADLRPVGQVGAA